MLGKLFGGKKSNDGFYVQMDDALDGKQTDNGNGKKATTAVVEEKKAEPAPAKAAVAAPAKAKESASKATNKKDASGAETAPVAPAPKKVAEYEPPFWVKAMYANNINGSNKGKAEGSVKSFADNYLMPTPTRSRRRPGPSLNPFMDMARQVKR
jgi:hypothetical protein